jgi:hypothetical protein
MIPVFYPIPSPFAVSFVTELALRGAFLAGSKSDITSSTGDILSFLRAFAPNEV